jgi:peptidoglycan LD-endopeptidase CwlK
MTYSFSAQSLACLKGVDPDLVFLAHQVMGLQIMDFSVREGVRSLDRQKELVRIGKSKTMRSKHLIQSNGYGHAIDVYPHPIDMKRVNDGNAREIARFGMLYGLFAVIAKQRGIKIISGMDWDGDGETLDHTFFDGPHIQLV